MQVVLFLRIGELDKGSGRGRVEHRRPDEAICNGLCSASGSFVERPLASRILGDGIHDFPSETSLPAGGTSYTAALELLPALVPSSILTSQHAAIGFSRSMRGPFEGAAIHEPIDFRTFWNPWISHILIRVC